MPIFEFECKNCGKSFEELVWTSYLEENVACPQCGGKQVKKKISRFASKSAGGLSLGASSSCGSTGYSGGG